MAPGAKGEPVAFGSPLRSIKFDRVDDVSQEVKLATAVESNGKQPIGIFEVSVPLSLLGLKPEPNQKLRGDIGILRGSSGQTLQRVYWRNKAIGVCRKAQG